MKHWRPLPLLSIEMVALRSLSDLLQIRLRIRGDRKLVSIQFRIHVIQDSVPKLSLALLRSGVYSARQCSAFAG